MNFNKDNFYKKKYSKGILFFIKGFNFQSDIPNRQNIKQQDFLGKTALLEFSKRENINVYITNEDLKTNFEKIDNETYLVSIKKFINFYQSLKNKTNFDLAHAFFTNNLDIKNTYFSDDDYSEIFKREDFQSFLNNLDKDDLLKIKENFPKIKDLDLSKISDLDILNEIQQRNLNQKDFFEFIKKFLSSKKDFKIEELQNLTKTIDFKKIEKALEIWEKNKINSKEVQFWQKFLKDNPWIISQIFSAPFAYFKSEFYVGGHYSGDSKGSKNVDFGYKNKFSQNISIIEIKTPITQLVEKNSYGGRSGIYGMSKDLMGAISQVLNQKDDLQKDFNQNNNDKNFKVWNPKIILIIGSEENEKLNEDRRACFELFKNSQKEIEIITFDELFEKINNLKNIFNK
jgi:hypothetical protein